MKKAFIISMIFALSLSMSLPAVAETVTTGLTQVQSGGLAPIVKAKWEMNPDTEDVTPYGYLGTDDSTAANAQFNPTGQKDVNRTITICAIATDPDGVSDIAGVYGDVYYPKNIDLGPSHIKLPNQSGAGCGEFMQEDELIELPKLEGIELFCNKIQNGNTNLPTFNVDYDYAEICNLDGELWKETAKVFCAEKDLSYEDPSGMYGVTAVAQDANSLTDTLDNEFEYLPLTAFETDFTNVDYGNVKLNTGKIVNGDLTWGNDIATVRNVGNTRMKLTVMQDDMGLGKTSGNWNVMFDARVGSVVPHQTYSPDETIALEDALDLSEMDEVDFSILVNKFPINNPGTSWTGNMTLGAVEAPHLLCGPPVIEPEIRNISLENKEEGTWTVISDDQTYGDISYSHNNTTFNGTVTGTGLVAGGKYQITFNSQADCPTFTAASLAGAGSNAFESGFWNGGPNLDPACVPGGEGVFNIGLIGDHYTFIADGSGAFNHPFSLNLPPGDYVDVKVLVKKMLDTHVAPWADTGAGYPAFNLYETASINFTVLP